MAKWGEIKCREAASKCPRCEELSNCVAVLEAKLSKCEALLAKAVETLERIAMHDTQGWAITTLAELKGRDDE